VPGEDDEPVTSEGVRRQEGAGGGVVGVGGVVAIGGGPIFLRQLNAPCSHGGRKTLPQVPKQNHKLVLVCRGPILCHVIEAGRFCAPLRGPYATPQWCRGGAPCRARPRTSNHVAKSSVSSFMLERGPMSKRTDPTMQRTPAAWAACLHLLMQALLAWTAATGAAASPRSSAALAVSTSTPSPTKHVLLRCIVLPHGHACQRRSGAGGRGALPRPPPSI
jgi:hypothetical protein